MIENDLHSMSYEGNGLLKDLRGLGLRRGVGRRQKTALYVCHENVIPMYVCHENVIPIDGSSNCFVYTSAPAISALFHPTPHL